VWIFRNQILDFDAADTLSKSFCQAAVDSAYGTRIGRGRRFKWTAFQSDLG
jgi:hypothetical protein